MEFQNIAFNSSTYHANNSLFSSNGQTDSSDHLDNYTIGSSLSGNPLSRSASDTQLDVLDRVTQRLSQQIPPLSTPQPSRHNSLTSLTSKEENPPLTPITEQTPLYEEQHTYGIHRSAFIYHSEDAIPAPPTQNARSRYREQCTREQQACIAIIGVLICCCSLALIGIIAFLFAHHTPFHSKSN